MIVQCKICDHPVSIKIDSLGNIGKHMKTHSQEQLRDLKRKEKVMVQLTLDQVTSNTKFKSISISSELFSLFWKNLKLSNRVFFHAALNLSFESCETIQYRTILRDSE